MAFNLIYSVESSLSSLKFGLTLFKLNIFVCDDQFSASLILVSVRMQLR